MLSSLTSMQIVVTSSASLVWTSEYSFEVIFFDSAGATRISVWAISTGPWLEWTAKAFDSSSWVPLNSTSHA